MQHIIKPYYSDYNTYKSIIEDLIKEYPFLKAEIIGRSALGRGIFSLSAGNTENCVLYVAGIHGCHNLTSLILLLFTERICHSVKHGGMLCSIDIKKAMENLGITVIPCLNPDGAEIFLKEKGAVTSCNSASSSDKRDSKRWKANAMGVDINRNFGTLWHSFRQQAEEKGISRPCASLFAGDYPESEAETKTLTRLCRVRVFRQCLSLFEKGEEIFYKSSAGEPAQSSMMAKILACSNGYSLNESENQWGFQDWFISEMSKPAFTVTAGKDEAVNPDELYGTYEKLEESLTLFALM